MEQEIKFRQRKGYMIWCWILALSWPLIPEFGFAISFAIQGRAMNYDFTKIPTPGWVILVGCYTFFITLSTMITDSRPDINVTDESISKLTFGWTRKTIRWKDVSKIEVDSMVRPAAGGSMRFVKVASRHGTIFVSDRIGGFDQFVQLPLQKSRQYSIPVHRKDAA